MATHEAQIQERLDLWAKAWVDSYNSKHPDYKHFDPVEWNKRVKPHMGFDVGPKYIRVWTSNYGNRSAEAFVDRSNGQVFKAASWKAPAKGVRYSLLDNESFENMLKGVAKSWSGAYLYCAGVVR